MFLSFILSELQYFIAQTYVRYMTAGMSYYVLKGLNQGWKGKIFVKIVRYDEKI